jgi:hypothetical protein
MEGIVLSVMPTVETTTNAMDITEMIWKEMVSPYFTKSFFVCSSRRSLE